MSSKQLSAFAIAMALLLGSNPEHIGAATIHVPADSPSIQAGIDAGSVGDTVLIAPGVYTGASNTAITFAGKDIVVMGSGVDATTLDCLDQAIPVVLFENGESRDAVLQDLTLRNNHFPYEPPGIRIQGSSPTLKNLHITDFDGAQWESFANYYHGAAIHCRDGSPRLEDVVVWDCRNAGALSIHGPAPVLENVVISGCHAHKTGAGGLDIVSDGAYIRNLIVRNCSAFDGGGAGVVCNGSMLFEDCRFEGNTQVDHLPVNYTNGAGGGMMCWGSPTIRRCEFVENSAQAGGGGIAIGALGSPLIEDVLFDRCDSGMGGGAVFVNEASPTFRRVTIAQSGLWFDTHIDNEPSAIICFDSSPVLDRVIIAHSDTGYGIWTDEFSLPALECCDLFANPTGNYGGAITDQTGVDGNISQDPLFCDPMGSDYAVDATSPCLPWNNDCGVQIGAYGWGCGVTQADTEVPAVPMQVANYPNPFNPSTEVRFVLPEASAVDVRIVDSSGREVRRLLDGSHRPVGVAQLTWDGRDDSGQPLPSGVYFCEVEAGEYRATRKMTLLK